MAELKMFLFTTATTPALLYLKSLIKTTKVYVMQHCLAWPVLLQHIFTVWKNSIFCSCIAAIIIRCRKCGLEGKWYENHVLNVFFGRQCQSRSWELIKVDMIHLRVPKALCCLAYHHHPSCMTTTKGWLGQAVFHYFCHHTLQSEPTRTTECMDKADMYVDQQRCVVGIILLSIHKASYCVAANMTDTVSLPPSFFNRLLYCWQTHFFWEDGSLIGYTNTAESNNIFLNSKWMTEWMIVKLMYFQGT